MIDTFGLPAFKQGSANKSIHVFNLIIHSRRPLLAALAAASLVLLAASACGDGGDIRIVAITPSPTPAASETGSVEPSSPLPPTSITPTPTPAPSGTVPDRPTDLLAGGVPVSSYLAGGSADIAGCLPGLVAAWGLAPVLGERCFFADIDGDGTSEFAFAVVTTTEAASPGDVWFFQGADEQFRLFSSARVLANEVLEDVVLTAAADLTGDRFPDLVISARICSAGVCAGRLLLASAHGGEFTDLAPAGLNLTGLHSLRIEDATGDGLQDVVLNYEHTPEPEAGPQRDFELVLNWAGLKFFDSKHPDPPRYLFHAIADADTIFDTADYQAARAQYEAAAANTALVDWRVEVGEGSGRRELAPYALLRAGISAVRTGDPEGALALFNQAATGFPASLHGQVASIFREGLEGGLAPAVACTTSEDYLRPQSSRYAEIWDYGFSNPDHQISDLCR